MVCPDLEQRLNLLSHKRIRGVAFRFGIMQQPQADECNQAIDDKPFKTELIAIKPLSRVFINNVGNNGC